LSVRLGNDECLSEITHRENLRICVPARAKIQFKEPGFLKNKVSEKGGGPKNHQRSE